MRRPIRLTKNILILLGLVGLFLVIQWWIKTFQQPGHMGIIESQTMETMVEPPGGAMPVAVEQVESSPFVSAVTYTGTAVAYNDIPVFPRVEGWVVNMAVYPGDMVRQGQLLAQLDTRELSSRVREAEFSRSSAAQGYQAAIRGTQQAQAQVQRAQQAIQASRANLEYWQNEIRRAKTLVGEEVITVEEFQREQSQFEAAESQYNQALSELRAAQRAAEGAAFQAASQRDASQQAAAAAQTQRIIKSYAAVTAPKSGMVAERLLPPGTLVKPDTQILRLVQLQPLRIQANVAESDFNHIRVGDPVRIWDRRESNTPIDAKVSAIFPAASLQTRTAIVEAVIPNEREQFVPGDYVIMAINTGMPHMALTVPNKAIRTIDQQKALWVVQDGKARLRYVTTGGMDGRRREIMRGLKAGDVVITEGYVDLRDGAAVVTAEYGKEGLKTMPKALASNRLSPENGYRIRQSVEHQTVLIELSTKPPKVGENELTITIASAHGAVPSNLALDITTVMPAMPSMANPKPQIRKLAADRFQVKAMFGMPGLWEMNLTLKEGGREVGKLRFDTKVPD